MIIAVGVISVFDLGALLNPRRYESRASTVRNLSIRFKAGSKQYESFRKLGVLYLGVL